MPLPQPKKVDISKEIVKLKGILELPITNIIFDKTYYFITLYVNHDNIGTLLYNWLPNGIAYDTSNIQKLAWDKVYIQYQDDLLTKINNQEPKADHATIGLFRTLYVKDKQGTILKIAYCRFVNDEWPIGLGEH